MDLAKLQVDWAEDPRLRRLGFDTVEELAEHLVKLHKNLLSDEGGPFGYLYAQQLRRVRELQKELQDVSERQASRRHPLRPGR